LQDAYVAVEAMEIPVKIELDTVCGNPGTVLLEESRSAALLCVGAPKANPHGPYDSLALNMAACAHCTVAVVPATEASVGQRHSRVVTVLEPSNIDYDVLQRAMEESELRGLALHIVMTAPSTGAVDELLISWTQTYPHIDLHVEHADLLRYLSEHGMSVKSVVLGAARTPKSRHWWNRSDQKQRRIRTFRSSSFATNIFPPVRASSADAG